jgi:hypothetical protein
LRPSGRGSGTGRHDKRIRRVNARGAPTGAPGLSVLGREFQSPLLGFAPGAGRIGLSLGGGLGLGMFAGQLFLGCPALAFGLPGFPLDAANVTSRPPFACLALASFADRRLPDLLALPGGRFRAVPRHHVWAFRGNRTGPARHRRRRPGMGATPEYADQPNAGHGAGGLRPPRPCATA